MVQLVDDQVGRLLEVLRAFGRLEDTIVVVNSDQGFQLGEHGVWKKRDFYETNICVPLIMAGLGLPSERTVEKPVEMVDFMPTLLELSGFATPKEIAGRSLLPLIHGVVAEWCEAWEADLLHGRSGQRRGRYAV
jgi:arylsulfatase A-like enzyme